MYGEEIAHNRMCRTVKRGRLYVVVSNVDDVVVTAFRRYNTKTILKRKRKMQRKWRRDSRRYHG